MTVKETVIGPSQDLKNVPRRLDKRHRDLCLESYQAINALAYTESFWKFMSRVGILTIEERYKITAW